MPAIYLKMKGGSFMVALRLLGIGNVAAGVASCRSRLVQSVVRVKPALSPIEGQGAPNRQPPLSPFIKGDLRESLFRSTELTTKSKGELNRMAGRLCRTFRLLGLFLFLIMPSVFLADKADAAWGTSTVDNTSSADTGWYSSIAVGTSGAAYISYQDVTNGKLMYATNVGGSWGTTTLGSASYTSIAVGTSGAAYISYYDTDNTALVYATNVSGSWGTTTVDNTSAADTGKYCSIAVGTSGAAYISYQDVTNGNLMYATNVGGSWGTTTLDSANDVGYYTSIAVGTSGAAYISYLDVTTDNLMYATNVGGSWGTSTVDSTTSNSTGHYSSIAVGTSGAVYISYLDNTNKNLMYATNVGGSWGTTTVDSAGNTGLYTSIAVGTSGAAYISYYDDTNDKLMYATNVSGAWGTTILDNMGNIVATLARYTSIAVGTSGAVYISYYDGTNNDLKYAANPTHTAVTGAASVVSTSGATLGGTANATGLATTAFFQYGVTSGSYTGTSSTQSVSGTSDTAVSIALSSLSAGTTYYYRLANQHYTNLVYGGEASFSTSSAPVAEPTPIKETLTVTSTSPSSGATGVSVTTAVSATFNLLINGSTATTETFKLSDESGDVSGSVVTNGATITFTPSLSLSYGTKYTATVTTKVQAANWAGTTLDSNYSWTFTTESAPIVPTPTATVTSSPTPAATPTAVSTATPTPTPAITPTQPADLSLSKEVAYLSGDTVAVTVVDTDRDANAASEDTLTTAIKVTALNYFAGGDLTLDLKENAVNSGTFLAAIKTGTTTIGGASSSTRSNIGTIKTIQGGTATVIYTDTTPDASTITKTLSFSSSDATLAFDAESYTVGSYAVVTHVDAEENRDLALEDTLLNHVIIETSSINRAWMKLAETGADTGTFKGSILVSSDATIDNERIQASNGNTLTAGCTDEINTSGAPRGVTAVSRVVSSEPTPTPITTPTPTATPTPTPCEPEDISVSPPKSLTLKRNASGDITVTVTGEDDCAVAGEPVTATTNTAGEKRISISPASDTTDANGEIVFTITAKNKTGNARVTFKAEGVKKSLRYTVKVKKK